MNKVLWTPPEQPQPQPEYKPAVQAQLPLEGNLDEMSEETLIQTLGSVIGQLSSDSQEFAGSMISQYGRKGKLSDKQWYWVKRLIERAQKKSSPPKTQAVGDFSGVAELFDTAKQNGLKYPKIRLQMPDGTPIALQMAGPKSKYYGSIMITDGGPYGARRYFGRVTVQGQWEETSYKPNKIQGLVGLLKMLALEPAKTVAHFGRMTGNCSFCMSQLTDERSTDVGYGPRCASKWGLPWGTKK